MDFSPCSNWATDKRTLKNVIVASGVGLFALIALVAAIDARIPQAVVDVIYVPVILAVVCLAIPIIGLRMLLVRKKEKEDFAATPLVFAYALSAVPIGLATLLLGALTTFAFLVEMETAPALAVSIVALLGVWVLFSLAVKIIVNVRMLRSHWTNS